MQSKKMQDWKIRHKKCSTKIARKENGAQEMQRWKMRD